MIWFYVVLAMGVPLWGFLLAKAVRDGMKPELCPNCSTELRFREEHSGVFEVEYEVTCRDCGYAEHRTIKRMSQN